MGISVQVPKRGTPGASLAAMPPYVEFGHLSTDMAGMTHIKEHDSRLKSLLLSVLPAAAFLLVSFFILEDYGPNIDSQKNFLEGAV